VAAPAPQPASAGNRTVSNWRERRPVSSPARAYAPAPELVEADEYDPAAMSQVDEERENGRAARTRMIVGAAILIAAIIAGVVVFSSGSLPFGPGAKEKSAPAAAALPKPEATPPALEPGQTDAGDAGRLVLRTGCRGGPERSDVRAPGRVVQDRRRATRVLAELKDSDQAAR
jgi:hypothetical protein